MKPFHLLAISALAMLAAIPATRAEDLLKLAVPQRGAWDTGIPDVGQKAGIFAKHGIKMEMLYTAGAGETTQAVISGSVDIGTGTGTSGVMATFAKGAPVRPFSSQMTGADDIFWYVPAESPIHSLKDAAGKTMAFSSNGSSSNLGALALIKQAGVSIKAIAAGGPPATFTQTMSGQIDIGWATPPYVIDDVKSGRVRMIARESDLEDFKNQTVRMNFATVDTLTKRADVIKRFNDAYKETIDFMYSDDPAALKTYADFAGISVEKAKVIRDEFFPKNNLNPARLSGLENAMADALALKFIAAPFTKEQTDEFLKYYVK